MSSVWNSSKFKLNRRPYGSLSVLVLFLSLVLSSLQAVAAIESHKANVNDCAGLLSSKLTDSLAQNQNWTPNLKTLEGRVELLMSVLERHPHFVTSNLSFRRNVLDTFSHIPAITEHLKDNAASREVTPPQVLSVRYSAEKVVYNESGVQKFKKERIEDVKNLNLLPSGNLQAQLRHLKQDKKAVKTLLRVMPFLFDSDGKAKFTGWNDAAHKTIAETIEKSTSSDWENLYFDFLKGHIDSQIEILSKEKGMGEIQIAYQNVKNQFIEKDVRSIIRPIGKTEESNSIRTLSAETAPADIASSRGFCGGDCSILSVPFYTSLKGANAHFLRKSKDLMLEPDGYAFGVVGEIDTPTGPKKIPYIITVNGATLTEADVRVAISLVIKSNPELSNSRLVAFPDWGHKTIVNGKEVQLNRNLVNWETSRRAMTHKRGKSMKIRLPAGWDELEKYHDLNNRTGYTNYYRREVIENVSVGEFDPGVQILGEVEHQTLALPGYRRPKKIEEISSLERAIVANQALADKGSEKVSARELLSVLKIDEADVKTAAPLISVSPTEGLTIGQYRALEKRFGFGLKDVLAFEIKTRSKILSQLYEEQPSLLTEHRGRTNAKIEEALETYYGKDSFKAIVTQIWRASDLSDEKMVHLLAETRSVLGSTDIAHYIAFKEKLDQTSLMHSMQGLLSKAYLDSTFSDVAMAKGLFKLFHSKSLSARTFRQEILAQGLKLKDWQERFPILLVYHEVLNKFGGKFDQWIADQNIGAAQKADFLITLVGNGETVFDTYLAKVPRAHLAEMWGRIDQRSDLRSFLDLATKKGAREFLLKNATIESFLYLTNGMPKVGEPKTFEMGEPGQTHTVTLTRPVAGQATSETQLKWALVMEENPSRFQEDGMTMSIGDAEQSASGFSLLNWGKNKVSQKRKNIKVSNQPVEQVSWWSAVAYMNKKSEIEGKTPVYDLSGMKFKGRAEDGTLDRVNGEIKIIANANGYRHGSEAEQELMARGGTTTTYSFGDDAEDLPLHGWFDKNSGGKTHPVAQLRPNPLGYHDVHGNVWEWGGDWYDNYPVGHVIDPTGPSQPSTGSYRVVRGGSYYGSAQDLRSALRSYNDPGVRGGNVGFRPVRTP